MTSIPENAVDNVSSASEALSEKFQTIPNNRGDNFTDIHLPETTVEIKEKKVPRRILHFSDGTLEEYSTDEEEEEEEDTAPATVIDPKSLTWPSWFWHYTVISASKALGAADFCGEKLAWFFGITSPKYQYAIDEYYRIKEEEEEEKKRMEREAAAEWGRVNHAMNEQSLSSQPTSHQESPINIYSQPPSVTKPKY